MERLSLDLDLIGDRIGASLRSSIGEVIAEGRSDVNIDFLLSHPVLAKLTDRKELLPSEIEAFGRVLGEAAAPAGISQALAHYISTAGIKLSLRISEDLEDLPWELTFLDQRGAKYLGLHPGVRLSRRTDGQMDFEPQETFRVLVVFSDPQSENFGKLGKAENEFTSLCRALSDHQIDGVKLDVLPHATAGALSRHMKNGKYDAFHFIGHGEIRPSGGVLIFEGGADYQTSTMFGDELAELLRLSGTKVVVLSGCQTSGGTSTIGSQLAKAGISTVVGMQFPVSDTVAHLFARTLYSALTQGHSIEEAMFEGRTAIAGSGQDWAAPVLMTSSPSSSFVSARKEKSSLAKGNLPKPVTSFVGREAEIARCAELVATEQIVVLLGSGGIGKTRLSIEVGQRIAAKFVHGVWQVQFDSITAEEQVMDAIGRVFGLRSTADQVLEQRIVEFLSDRQLLLILDNCEHVVNACREAARMILNNCPGVRLLATSREVLSTGAETIIRVPSLSYPSQVIEADTSSTADSIIASFEGVKLLVIRAKTANSEFLVDQKTVIALGLIARRLDGIPLALELAASRVRTFSPKQILDRLTKDLAWLDLENPSAVPRQKTLRATIDWSYSLLSQQEKAVFNRFGVFIGGFSLDGAQAVAAFGEISRSDVLSLLSSLVDKSLLVAEPFEFEMRYRLLDTCRHYALEKLEIAGETAEARTRHLAFVNSFVEVAFDGMFHKTDQQERWVLAFAAEHDNCLHALDWALTEGKDVISAARMVKTLFNYWFSARNFDEAKRCLLRVLERIPASEEALTIELMTFSAVATIFAGDPLGINLAIKARSMALQTHPSLAAGFVAVWLAECAYMVGRFDLAYDLYEEQLDEKRKRGKEEGTSQLMFAILNVHRQNYAVAEDEFLKFFKRREGKNDQRGAGYALCHLAHLDALKGGTQFPRRYAQGLQKLNTVNDHGAIAEFLPLATSAFLPDNPATAAVIQGFAKKLIEESGSTPDHLVDIWGAEVRSQTMELIPGAYEASFKDGRTMTLELVLQEFDRFMV